MTFAQSSNGKVHDLDMFLTRKGPMVTTYSIQSVREALRIPPRFLPQQASQLPISILIVDDNQDFRLFMRMGLENLGYQCEEAQHGLEALRKLQNFSFHVVLTDLQMPFLDGMELVQQIQENPVLGDPLVIMMTGSETRFPGQLGLALGIQEILPKPCGPSDVDRIVRQAQAQFPWAA